MIQDQRSGENNEASNTVIIPVTAMARLLIAPSISPSSIALAVPIAWEEEPRARPFAIGCVMRKILQMSSPKMFPSTPVTTITATVIVTIAAKFLGNAHSDHSSD